MDDEGRDAMRVLSDVLFGQRYRLELMVAIASSDDGLVCLTDLAATLEVTLSNLQRGHVRGGGV